VKECAVVGVTSEKWGQKVCAVVVLTAEGKSSGKDGKQWSPLDMRKAMKERIVAYKIPQVMVVVDSIPRNAMGKINKKSLVAEIWPRGASPAPSERVPASA
jgi:malonyl-CoA/methylmalonyl-CoA synthetase